MSWFDINPKNFSPLKFSEKIFPAAEYFKQNFNALCAFTGLFCWRRNLTRLFCRPAPARRKDDASMTMQ